MTWHRWELVSGPTRYQYQNRHQRRVAAEHKAYRGDEFGESYHAMSIDHVWPGAEEKLRETATEGRAARTNGAVACVAKEVGEGTARCTECQTPISSLAELGEVSVAHLWWADTSVGIPFGTRCATSEEAVSRMAKEAIGRMRAQWAPVGTA